MDLKGEPYLTPLPVDEDISSLSAILLNDSYYRFTLDHSIHENDLNRARTEALICLKAKAFLDMKARKDNGEIVDEKHIRKHKADVFRLALLLSPQDIFVLPSEIKADMQTFTSIIQSDLPDSAIFKEMGAGNIDMGASLDQFVKNFSL